MDKASWYEIRENKYAIPAGEEIGALTEELISYIDSPDPELRDAIGYETFANWLDQDRYSPEIIRTYIPRLAVNLQSGLGERDTDSVFTRAFSALYLAEIIHHDNQDPFLEKEEVHSIFAKALTYLAEERDPRGYVTGKGWAHALAHTADLLSVLASNRYLARTELEQLLGAITEKVTQPTDWVYIHDEDDRLVRAAIAAHLRKIMDEFFLKQWLNSFLYADGRKRAWKNSFQDPAAHNAYANTRNFLRSLHLRAAQSERLFARDFLLQELRTTMEELRQY
jgi:hypothetical protein